MQKKGEFIVPLISPLCYLSLSKEQKVDKVHFKVQVRFADELNGGCRSTRHALLVVVSVSSAQSTGMPMRSNIRSSRSSFNISVE